MSGYVNAADGTIGKGRRMITVHHFTVWDPVGERTITPPLKSPAERISRIGGTIVADTAENVNESDLDLHGRHNPKRG
jgi:hypothetical protein